MERFKINILGILAGEMAMCNEGNGNLLYILFLY